MFKSILGVMKGLGKKAIGFVRGLNGNKAAKLLAGSLQTAKSPFKDAVPFLEGLGNFINEKLDSWSKDDEKTGGVNKPSLSRRERRQLRRQQRQQEEPETDLGTKGMFATAE